MMNRKVNVAKTMKTKIIGKIIIVVSLFVVFAKNIDAQPAPKRPPRPLTPHNMPAPPAQPNQAHRHPRRTMPDAHTQFHIFYVDEIEREDGEIEIEFNMPFKPESVTNENILINNEPLPHEAHISFNRRNTKIKIRESHIWAHKEISLEIKNILSINDLEMQKLPALYLRHDDEYERDEPHKVRWVLPQ